MLARTVWSLTFLGFFIFFTYPRKFYTNIFTKECTIVHNLLRSGLNTIGDFILKITIAWKSLWNQNQPFFKFSNRNRCLWESILTLITLAANKRTWLVRKTLIYVVKKLTKGYLVGLNSQKHANLIKVWLLLATVDLQWSHSKSLVYKWTIWGNLFDTAYY